jgi:endonuclease/exonuclease/phosphatase family metal-dependent hydrolase
LAEWTGYPYWVEERNLDFRLLFWKWRFGNAILSKHPITETTVIDLPGFWALESLPVGKKRGVVCDIQVGGKLIRIAGVHLCHRSEPFRAKPADPLGAMAAESPHAFCVIGDLNSTAPKFRLPANVPQGVNAIRVLDACERLRRSPRSKPTVA